MHGVEYEANVCTDKLIGCFRGAAPWKNTRLLLQIVFWLIQIQIQISNRRDQAVCRVAKSDRLLGEMYGFLASHGDRYSILDKGVVTEDTLSGRAAIEYLEYAALSQGKNLAESDKLAVKTAMAGKYLDTLQGIIDQSESGEVSREITAREAQALHDAAFGELGRNPQGGVACLILLLL